MPDLSPQVPAKLVVMQPHEALKKARKITGKGQQELALAVGLENARSWRHWESGETPLNMKRMNQAARAHGFNTWEDLLAAVGETPFSAQSHPQNKIPLFNDVPAGNGDFDPTSLGEDNGYSGVMLDPAMFGGVDDPMAYAVRVKGDSMMPEFAEGEIVVCSPSAERTPGMFGVFRLDDGDCGIKVIEEGSKPGTVRLSPLNKRHPTREVPEKSIVRLAKVICKTTIYH